MNENVSIIGLGKLGSPMAACFASKGLRVIGVDADPRKVDAFNNGKAPVFEPQLDELLRKSTEFLSATDSIEQAVLATDVTFIVVATPSEPSGGFSLTHVLPVCQAIGLALRAKEGFHLVVLTSTVMPGSTGSAVRCALERASGKRVGYDFGLCYNPEFIALGSVIRDFLNPDLLLIGQSDSHSGDILEALYKGVCENTPSVARMNFINAEVTKLAINTYLTTKISFANMIARLCEKLPDANVDIVTAALGNDSRIGAKYLKGSVNYGGPCFPRDNLALGALARQVGSPDDLAKATDRFNRSQVSWLADLAQSYSQGTIGVLGLTYKPHTDVVEEAAGLLLAQELAGRGVTVLAYDPSGSLRSASVLDGKVRFVASAQECIDGVDVVVVATAWPEFSVIPRERWQRQNSPRTVIDCWRALNYLDKCEAVRYVRLGIGDMKARPEASAVQSGPVESESFPLLTIFTLPKPFRGHFGVIQRNAIASWTRLHPRPEIILLGDEEGTARIAHELGLRHIPSVRCNEHGTPLMNDLFEQAQSAARHDLLCYINADIIVPTDFMKAVKQVAAWRDQFLMVGQRINVNLDEPELYASADSEARMRELILRQNPRRCIGAIDYFLFPRGLFTSIPPFAIGRGLWDNWLLKTILSLGVPVVDASDVILVVHQNHPQPTTIFDGEEGKRNRELAGDALTTLEDATHRLTANGVKSNSWRRSFKRLLRTTRSSRHALGLRRKTIERLIAKVAAD